MGNKAKKKILYLSHAPYEGGAEYSLKLLINHLDRRKYEPMLACPNDAPYLQDVLDVVHFNFKYNWKKYRLVIPMMLDLWKLYQIIRKSNADIIHANGIVCSLLLGWLGNLIGEKKIAHMRDLDPLSAYKIKLLDNNDVLIANSKQTQAFLRKNGIISPVEFVYNGVDLSIYDAVWEYNLQREKDLSKGIVIGSVGQLYPRKGFRYLILAISILRGKGFPATLQIAGQDPTEDQRNLKDLQTIANELGVAHCVNFVGYVSPVHEFFKDLDVFVLASLEEPFGRVLIEAQASGVPVIGTKVGGIPEIITHKNSGMLVEPRSARMIAETILQLVENRTLYKMITSNARSEARKRFDITTLTQKIEHIYENLEK